MWDEHRDERNNKVVFEGWLEPQLSLNLEDFSGAWKATIPRSLPSWQWVSEWINEWTSQGSVVRKVQWGYRLPEMFAGERRRTLTAVNGHRKWDMTKMCEKCRRKWDRNAMLLLVNRSSNARFCHEVRLCEGQFGGKDLVRGFLSYQFLFSRNCPHVIFFFGFGLYTTSWSSVVALLPKVTGTNIRAYLPAVLSMPSNKFRSGMHQVEFAEACLLTGKICFLRLQYSFWGHRAGIRNLGAFPRFRCEAIMYDANLTWFILVLNVLVCIMPANRLVLTVKATGSPSWQGLLIYVRNGRWSLYESSRGDYRFDIFLKFKKHFPS